MARMVVVAVTVMVALAVAVLLRLATMRRRAVVSTLKAATSGPRRRSPGPDGARRARRYLVARVDAAASAAARPLRRLLPATYLASTRRRLTLGGRDRVADLDRFLVERMVSACLVPCAFVITRLSPLPQVDRLLVFLAALVLLGLGPEALVNRRASARQERIRHDLPALVELLMIGVEAGLGFDQAIRRASHRAAGPLADEFSRFLGEVRMGVARRDALEGVDTRTDVAELRSFLMALVQAETFGVSVGSILRGQAEEIRIAQRQHVQELAQKAPVKMLFPLVLCVLPSLFVVVVGPAAIEIYRTIVR